MTEIKIYLLALTLIHLWVMLFEMKFDHTKKKGEQFSYKFKFLKYIDSKPINCKLCLSFWCGLMLAVIFQDVLYVSLCLPQLIRE